MMLDIAQMPDRIANKIRGLQWIGDDVGKSKSHVLLFEEMVLKIEKISRNSAQEIELLGWLDGKLPVPKIIEAQAQNGYSFVLMSKLPGEMVCTGSSLQNMEETVKALASGLKMLWQIDIADCPCRFTVAEKLLEAKYDVENDLVDTSDFEPETLSSQGFAGVMDLYNYLERNRPKEDLVFCHGDFTFPNILVSGNMITGLIDWGNGGVADRWQDISLCYRALSKKYAKYGLYSEKQYSKYKALFFGELGIEPDEEKVRYYNLLDEFF